VSRKYPNRAHVKQVLEAAGIPDVVVRETLQNPVTKQSYERLMNPHRRLIKSYFKLTPVLKKGFMQAIESQAAERTKANQELTNK